MGQDSLSRLNTGESPFAVSSLSRGLSHAHKSHIPIRKTCLSLHAIDQLNSVQRVKHDSGTVMAAPRICQVSAHINHILVEMKQEAGTYRSIEIESIDMSWIGNEV